MIKQCISYGLVLMALLTGGKAAAQNPLPRKVTLNEAIDIAQRQSVEVRSVINTARVGLWNYRAFRASTLPKLSLSATVPNYNRVIDRITLPTGKDVFVARNYAYSTMQLDVSQHIGLTGGNLSVSSGLNRLDMFGDQRSLQYSTFPMMVSYEQGSLFYNSHKWRRKIEPLLFEESGKQYAESLEQVAVNTIEKYFQYFLAQTQWTIDGQNLLIADTLLKVTQLKMEIVTRDRNDFLEARLNQLTARRSISFDRVTMEASRQQFCQYLGLQDSLVALELPLPQKVTHIDPDEAIIHARKNRRKIVEMRRRQLQAEQLLAETKSLSGPKMGVAANIGLSQSNSEFSKAFTNLQRQQSVALTVSIPLIDWGANRYNIKRARADKSLVESSIAQEQMVFDHEVLLSVMEYNSITEVLAVSREAQDIAIEKFERAKQKYLSGNLTFLELATAQQQKDYAIKDFVSDIRNYWMAYYRIRRLCLYDFGRGEHLYEQAEKMLTDQSFYDL